MFTFLAILVIIISGCNSRCVLNKDLSMRCDSVEDVRKIGPQNIGRNLVVESNGPKQRIQSNLFGRHSKLSTLHFTNSVNDIELHSFSGLVSLKDVKFVNCDLPTVKKFWFNDLPTLDTVNIINSKVASLEAQSFEGSYSLKHLTIEDNNIPRLFANTFSGTSIVKLILNRNRIFVIEESAFAKMPYLKLLSLHGNFLTSFNSKVTMGEVANLQGLFLSNNKLESFTERVFPSLEVLYLQNNRLTFLPMDFNLNFPRLFEINLLGNPWQCACYSGIMRSIYKNNVNLTCSDEYLNGQRPVCVVPETSVDKCAEHRNANDLYNTYVESLSKYPKIKSLCNEQIHISLLNKY